MPKRFNRKRKTKFVTKRALPFLLMKNAEPKFHEIDSTVTLTAASSFTLDLTFIIQGDGQDERIGQSIQATGVYFRAIMGIAGVATTQPSYTRVILYSKRQNATTDLLVTGPSLPDFDKYIIWSDKLVPNPWTNSISNSMVTIRKKFKPFMKVLYSGSGSGSVEKNNLRMLMSVNTGSIDVNFAVRLYYRDI